MIVSTESILTGAFLLILMLAGIFLFIAAITATIIIVVIKKKKKAKQAAAAEAKLAELNNLLASGAITKEEYDRQVAALRGNP